MVQPLDPTAAAFLMAENRRMPMHVGGLQLFTQARGRRSQLRQGPLRALPRVRRHRAAVPQAPVRSVRTGGQYVWREDDEFDIEYHVRHSALPKPGRVRELLELCSRLHSTRLATERPLWEWHLIEGLRDGRVAMYAKLHHALVDGVSAMRLLQSILTTDPDRTGMPAPWENKPSVRQDARGAGAGRALPVRRTPAGDAFGARHRRGGRRAPGRADQDAAEVGAQRDVGALALRAPHDPQPADHRRPALRRAGLADRAAARRSAGRAARR